MFWALIWLVQALSILTFAQQAAQTSKKYVKIDYELGKHSCSLPWIWDAVYHPYQRKLELLLIPHSACNYNATALTELLKVSPGYASYFPFLSRNMSAPFCDRKQELHRRLLGSAVMGRYKVTQDNEAHTSKEVYKRVISKIIQGSFGLAFLAPLRIEFSSISRINTSAPFELIIPKQLLLNYNRGVSMSNIPINVSNARPKIHNISMCTVTTNQNRRELVEWIEYHRLLGVQHFFLYDTLPARSNLSSDLSSTSSSLSSLLADYVRRGVVSVTSWRHTNCMPDVHVCRIVCSYTYNATSQQDEGKDCFAPPACINHIGALGSCYLRNRHSSKHMVTIDDDEFIHLHPRHFSVEDAPTGTAPLQSYISMVQGRYGVGANELKGIALYPQILFPCNFTVQTSSKPSLLPRLDTQHFGIVGGSRHEIKWILNTDLVEMLTVHYLTEKTLLPSQLEGKTAVHRANSTNEAFLFHYKNFSSRTLFDVGYNPPSLSDYSWREQLMCRLADEWNILRDHVGANTSWDRPKIQAVFLDDVRKRYLSFMDV